MVILEVSRCWLYHSTASEHGLEDSIHQNNSGSRTGYMEIFQTISRSTYQFHIRFSNCVDNFSHNSPEVAPY